MHYFVKHIAAGKLYCLPLIFAVTNDKIKKRWIK